MKQTDVKVLNINFNISKNDEFIPIKYNNIQLYQNIKQTYMIMKREFSEQLKLHTYHNLDWDVDVRQIPEKKFDNFIVDLNGIDNFISAKSIVFSDSYVRNIMATHLGIKDKKFYRFGVSGCRASSLHPGGEVVEVQSLDFGENKGTAVSVSGSMDLPKCEYSKAIMLSENDENLREERTVYSHTAWIEEREGNKPLEVNVIAKKNGANLMSLIHDFCVFENINAAGIIVKLSGNARIKGRVLKHIPKQAFKYLQEAIDIAVEKEFNLPQNAEMQMYGTIYQRYEPDWTKFTNGRQYERRGHYHAFILTDASSNIHEAFHVREVELKQDESLTIQIFLIRDVYRIYPLDNENELYYISSSHMEASEFAKKYTDKTSGDKGKLR